MHFGVDLCWLMLADARLACSSRQITTGMCADLVQVLLVTILFMCFELSTLLGVTRMTSLVLTSHQYYMAVDWDCAVLYCIETNVS
jgi:hypothetical protein